MKDPAESYQRDGGRALRSAVDHVEVAPTLTGEAVRDAVDQVSDKLAERADARALVTERVARIMASGPPQHWDQEVTRPRTSSQTVSG